jgi:hypothetical protein
MLSKRQRFEGRVFFRVAAWCLVVVCLLCGALLVAAHQQRARFAQKVQTQFDQLANVEVGRTSRAEVFALIPQLKPVLSTSGEFYLCEKNPDCVMFDTASPGWLLRIIQSNKLNWIIEKTHSGKAIGAVLRRLLGSPGIGWTRLCITFRDGRVEHWCYEVTATNHAADAILLRVFAVPASSRRFMEYPPHDENFDFWVRHIFDNIGDLGRTVVFTPAASEELKYVAVHPDLACLRSYWGCETANQLIPQALATEKHIREASETRLRGPVPCPAHILRSYAKAASWIATAEIASVRDDPTEPGVRLIQLRSVVRLKGVPRDLDRELSMVSYSGVSEQKGALNRVASLAKPGNKVILLRVGSYFFTDGACTTVPVSAENLRAVQHEIDGRIDSGQ